MHQLQLLLLISIMYLNIHYKVQIGNLLFTNINSGEVVSTWKELTDTGKLVLPRTFYTVDKTGKLKLTNVKESIKEKDPVKIDVAYNGVYNTEFEGYVRSISPEYPITLELEDDMLMLKGKPITESWEQIGLRDLVSFLLKEYNLNYETEIIDNINLGTFEINRASACRTLQTIKDEYGIYSFFRNKKLYVGFPYAFSFNRHVYHLQKNVKGRTNLKYRSAESFPVKVKAISHQENGTKISIDVPDVGDPDYDLTLLETASERTLNFGPLSATELKKYARAELDKFSYNGYYGTIKGFGLPLTEHGDIVEIRDGRFPELNSSNLIDKVTKRFGPVYYERINELGKQV